MAQEVSRNVVLKNLVVGVVVADEKEDWDEAVQNKAYMEGRRRTRVHRQEGDTQATLLRCVRLRLS